MTAPVTPATTEVLKSTAATETEATTCGGDSVCLSRMLAWERVVCKTGTAWGLLANAPLWALFIWWVVRHSVYAGITLLVITYGEREGMVAFSVLFLFAHTYKVVRYMQAENAKQEAIEMEQQKAKAEAKCVEP